MDRFHWLEPLAQVADSVFEWFYFFFHLSSFQSNCTSYIQWFTLIDMMNDKELCKRVIKNGSMKNSIRCEREEKKQSVLFDNENSTREPNRQHVRVSTEYNKWKEGVCILFTASTAIYANGIHKTLIPSSIVGNIFFDCTRFDITIRIIR